MRKVGEETIGRREGHSEGQETNEEGRKGEKGRKEGLVH